MLRSYLNLRVKHASIISAFCIKKNYEKYERWFAGANTRTEEKKLACGWRFSRALVYLMAWGQVHHDQRHVELKLFLASALGAQLQAIIFFQFRAAMDFWPIGIFERYYANLFPWKIRLYITL